MLFSFPRRPWYGHYVKATYVVPTLCARASITKSQALPQDRAHLVGGERLRGRPGLHRPAKGAKIFEGHDVRPGMPAEALSIAGHTADRTASPNRQVPADRAASCRSSARGSTLPWRSNRDYHRRSCKMTLMRTQDESCGPSPCQMLAALAAGILVSPRRGLAGDRELRFGLTPVFLTNDLELLARLKSYLERAVGSPVRLVTCRTYQEITSLLVSGQLDVR